MFRAVFAVQYAANLFWRRFIKFILILQHKTLHYNKVLYYNVIPLSQTELRIK